MVDPAYRPVGAVPVSRLLRSTRDTALTEIMEAVTEIPVDMDQEEVAYIFDKYHLISAPVIELNDIHATRSPSVQPSPVKALAARLARRLNDAKSRTSSPQMTAGFSGCDSAWRARKSTP